MSGRWESRGSEPWAVEIEHDCFEEDEGFVVSVDTEQDDDEGKHHTLIAVSPPVARLMAVALIEAASAADAANRLPAPSSVVSRPEEEGER